MHNCISDGTDHINIYSKGKTEIGRYLSNFTHAPILTTDGSFESIEGYWYWLMSYDDRLRHLWGFRAKQYGKSIVLIKYYTESEFKLKIREACWIKLFSNEYYLNLFINSDLEFSHYYVNKLNNKSIIGSNLWIVKMWENFRSYLKAKN